jgi:hypothetical protein
MATKKSAAAEPTEPDVVATTPENEATQLSEPAPSAVVTEEPVVAEPVVAEPVVADDTTTAEPVAVVPAADAVVAEPVVAAPAPQVIVVDAPVPPKKRGNRGLGVALAVAATLVFAALLAGVAIVLRLVFGADSAPAITDPQLYFPAIFFLIGLVLVTIVLNRAGWWSHIIGSVVVGAIVWFGSAGLALVYAGVATMIQSEANAAYFAALFSPMAVIAALLAREVSIWTGAILARRGRSLKVRNAEAHAAFEREQAELIPTTTQAAASE